MVERRARSRDRGKGWDGLGFSSPKPYFADGVGDNVFFGGQQSVEAESAANRSAQLSYGGVCHLILGLGGQHERDQRCEALILPQPENKIYIYIYKAKVRKDACR
jgi:hypothetical protein